MDALSIAADGGCSWTDPTSWLGCGVDAVAGSAFNAMVNAIGTAVISMLRFTSSFWMSVPSPTLAGGNNQPTQVIVTMQGAMAPVTVFIALISFTIAIGRLAWGFHAGTEIRALGRQFIAVAAGSVIVVVVTQTLIAAGDAYSTYIISQGAGTKPSEAVNKLAMASVFQGGTPGSLQGLWLFFFIITLLGSIVQCIFMFVRSASLIVLMAFVPPIAAGSATEEGWGRYKRLVMLVIGFALYKPVAATIYATGLLLLSSAGNGNTETESIKNALYGMTIIALAGLALPAFIKFVMPAAAIGSSNAFSGAAAVGAVAAGAAIVSMAGVTGGASAAGASGGGRGGAGPTGASPTPPGTGRGMDPSTVLNTASSTSNLANGAIPQEQA